MRQHKPVPVGSGGVEHYVVVNHHCQLRPAPNHDYVAIGLLRNGCQFRGFPYICNGQAWVKLHDHEAVVYVPDKHVREDGVWVPHSNPKYGKLIQSQEQAVVYGQSPKQTGSSSKGNGDIAEGGNAYKHSLVLRSNGCYEESIQLQWTLKETNSAVIDRKELKSTEMKKQFVVELVIDTASGRTPVTGSANQTGMASGTGPSKEGEMKVSDGQNELLTPVEGATVKRVECGKDMTCSLSNMPDGRYFLASVICTLEGNRRLRSRWIRTATLNKAGRNARLGSTDRLGNLRGKCTAEGCPCEAFIPQSEWNLNSAPQAYCRRCACKAEAHIIVKNIRDQNNEAPEKDATNKDKKDELPPEANKSTIALPPEAEHWDERDKNLWQWSNGALHPRENPHAKKRRRPRRPPDGVTGKVSVVVPTTEDRQHFHDQVWKCFVNQAWPNKELIIVETYKSRASPIFNGIDDKRLIFLKFRCGKSQDLSIGAKRNIAMHVADGDYLASFDDDDIYAPTYLETMIAEMVDKNAQFITLSTWYFFEAKTGQFGFCDPYAWAKAKNLSDKQIYGWLWGYGFSYVHRMQPALDRKILYPDQNMSEDITFIRTWKSMLGENCACLLFDKAGIVLHTIHGRNTSNSFGLREVPREEVLDTDFADLYDILRVYLERFPRKDGASSFILNKVNDKKRVKRKYRNLLVRDVERGNHFSINVVRGVTGAQLKETCADKYNVTPGEVKLFRKRPTPEQVKGESEAPATVLSEQEQEEREMAYYYRRIACTWVYGKNQTEYTVTRGTENWTLNFKGPHARTGTVVGVLKMLPSWIIGELKSLEGEHVGSIRLRYIFEVDSMVSNFKAIGREDWGKDIIAQRVGKLEVEQEEDEASTSQNQDENAPIQDEDRLELRAEDVWLVLCKKSKAAGAVDFDLYASVKAAHGSTTALSEVVGTSTAQGANNLAKWVNGAKDEATKIVGSETSQAKDEATTSVEAVGMTTVEGANWAKWVNGAKAEATTSVESMKPPENDEWDPEKDPATLEEEPDNQPDEHNSRSSSKSEPPNSQDGDWAALASMFDAAGRSSEHDKVAAQKFADDAAATSVEVPGQMMTSSEHDELADQKSEDDTAVASAEVAGQMMTSSEHDEVAGQRSEDDAAAASVEGAGQMMTSSEHDELAAHKSEKDTVADSLEVAGQMRTSSERDKVGGQQSEDHAVVTSVEVTDRMMSDSESEDDAVATSVEVAGQMTSSEHAEVAGRKSEDDTAATSVEGAGDGDAGDLELTVYIDYELGIKETMHVKAQSTIRSVKEQLLDRLCVIGETNIDEVALKLLGSETGPLPDDERLLYWQTELELCV